MSYRERGWSTPTGELATGRPIAKGLIERGTVPQPPVTASDLRGMFVRWIEERSLGDATPSRDGSALLVDVVDPTGPNGMRSFVVEISAREVT